MGMPRAPVKWGTLRFRDLGSWGAQGPSQGLLGLGQSHQALRACTGECKKRPLGGSRSPKAAKGKYNRGSATPLRGSAQNPKSQQRRSPRNPAKPSQTPGQARHARPGTSVGQPRLFRLFEGSDWPPPAFKTGNRQWERRGLARGPVLRTYSSRELSITATPHPPDVAGKGPGNEALPGSGPAREPC